MNNTEAISRIEQLAQDGSLVWASCRPAMAGGGWAVRIIGPIGPDRMGHGATLGEALADALRGIEAKVADPSPRPSGGSGGTMRYGQPSLKQTS